MVDFKKLLADRRAAMTPEERNAYDRRCAERDAFEAAKLTVTAIRTCASSQEESIVRVQAWIKESRTKPGEIWLMIDGGPTGHESMLFAHIQDALNERKPWAACLGSVRYDRLIVPLGSLRRIRDHFQGKAPMREPE